MSRLALLTPGRSAIVAPPMPPRQYATCAGIAKDPLLPDPVPLQKRRRDAAMTGGDDGGEGQKKRRRVMTASGDGAASAASAAASAAAAGVTAPVPPPPPPLPLPSRWPRASETALRIDAIRLVHRCSRSGRIRPPFNRSARMAADHPGQAQGQSQQGPQKTPALCRITVAARDGGRVLHCDGLRCTIETARDPYGGAHPLLRIRLDDPYSVDWATLTGFEHTCRPPGLREEDAGKQFRVTIEVEASAQSTAWPPLAPRDLVGSGSSSSSSGGGGGGIDGTGAVAGDACANGFCPHVLVDEHKGSTTTTTPPFACPYWRLESVFTGFARPLSAPLFLKHFSGKGDLVHRTDYETRVMGGTA